MIKLTDPDGDPIYIMPGLTTLVGPSDTEGQTNVSVGGHVVRVTETVEEVVKAIERFMGYDDETRHAVIHARRVAQRLERLEQFDYFTRLSEEWKKYGERRGDD